VSCVHVYVVLPTLASTSSDTGPRLAFAKDVSIFLVFNWLTSACRYQASCVHLRFTPEYFCTT